MNVGIRELKQHLSEYLDRAAGGEVVQVTERGVPKVHIVAVLGVSAMLRGVDEGWLRPPLRSDGLPPVRRAPSKLRVAEVINQDGGS